MRVQLTLLSTTILLIGCSPPQTTSATPPSAEKAAPTQAIRSRGVIYAVTREYNAITIQHDAIPEYDMPAMVMEFTVDDPTQLDGLEPGDNVAFELRSGLNISTISEVEADQPPGAQ